MTNTNDITEFSTPEMPRVLEEPLASMARDTVRGLIQQARLYIDPHTRDYKSTPPHRRGGVTGEDYVSGRDVEEWSGRVARFRDTWETRSRRVRDAILALVHPRQCYWIFGEISSGGDYIPSLVTEQRPGYELTFGMFYELSRCGETWEQAQALCDKINRQTLGVEPSDALDIVMSAMRASKRALD